MAVAAEEAEEVQVLAEEVEVLVPKEVAVIVPLDGHWGDACVAMHDLEKCLCI